MISLRTMMPQISYIIPILNEQDNIVKTIHRIMTSVPSKYEFEIIFIDDGSTDSTLDILKSQKNRNKCIKCISLSRNFGHQAALTAGLEYAKGQYIAILDGDLQDPPELIPEFIKYLEKGYDLVYGIRTKRKENILKKLSYFSFYRLLRFLSDIQIPLDSGDFCAMNRNFLNSINVLPEKSRFIRGLRAYVGFRQYGYAYERDIRSSGYPKFSFKKLLQLALDGIFNFSGKPLNIATYLGLTVSLVSILIGILILLQFIYDIKILGYSPSDIPGYTSLIVLFLFISGIQLLTIGILGNYISRVFVETKKRPVYFIREIIEYKIFCEVLLVIP